MNRRAFLGAALFAVPIARASAQAYPSGSRIILNFDDGAELKLQIIRLDSLDEWDGMAATGVYQVVWIHVENTGSVPKSWTPSNMLLVDSENRQFAFDENLSQSVTLDALSRDPFTNSTINPGLESGFGLVFDIPKDATGLKLFDREIGYSIALDETGNSLATDSVESAGAAPFGETVRMSSFAATVTGASIEDDNSLGLSGDLLVMLEVEAIGDGAYGFASSDDEALVTASDGRTFELSRPKTAILKMTLGQEMMIYLEGRKYPQYLVFSLGLNKAGANPVKPSDLIMSYWPANEVGKEYRFSLPV